MASQQFLNCKESDDWVIDMKHLVAELENHYSILEKVIYNGKDTISFFPVRFSTFERGAVIYKRPQISAEIYEHLIELFVFYPDAFYCVHSNYEKMLDEMRVLYSQVLNHPDTPNSVLDLVDSYYMVLMCGKQYLINKRIDQSKLKKWMSFFSNEDLDIGKKTLRTFEYLFYHGLLTAIFHIECPLPDIQSETVKMLEKRITSLLEEGINSVGWKKAYNSVSRIANIATVYLSKEPIPHP